LRTIEISEKSERIALFRYILWRPSVISTDDLTDIDLEAVIRTLEYWRHSGCVQDQLVKAHESF
jgi:hypothetical protein